MPVTYCHTRTRPPISADTLLVRALDRGELTNVEVDSEYICDLLFGPLLARVLLPTGLPLDDRLARQTVTTVLREML